MGVVSEITIRMPKDSLAKWLAALRSGEYAQGVGALKQSGAERFCCLGVLQQCLTGKVEHNSDVGALNYPSLEWLREQGITFKTILADNDRTPLLPTLGKTADIANDNRATFAEIADAIEACAEGY